MLTNELLETKYKAQQYLDQQAEHDLQKYLDKTHQIVLETERKYGIKFRYRQIEKQAPTD